MPLMSRSVHHDLLPLLVFIRLHVAPPEGVAQASHAVAVARPVDAAGHNAEGAVGQRPAWTRARKHCGDKEGIGRGVGQRLAMRACVVTGLSRE
eukprot:363660-Chlamydomonas_euryale.AAC.2